MKLRNAECALRRRSGRPERQSRGGMRNDCAIAALVIVVAVASVRAEVIDRVLAVVNGDVITLSDVTAARDLGLVATPSTVDDPVRFVLDALIDRALELDEVDRYGPPEPGTDAVDRQIAAVRARFPSP